MSETATAYNECHICMEPMQGRGQVVLKCGHEMCAECFAIHSRTNHTCPFCRDEFAPKINNNNHDSTPSFRVVEQIIIEHLLADTEFYYELNRRINWEIEPRYQVAILRTAVGNICLEAIERISRWYTAH